MRLSRSRFSQAILVSCILSPILAALAGTAVAYSQKYLAFAETGRSLLEAASTAFFINWLVSLLFLVLAGIPFAIWLRRLGLFTLPVLAALGAVPGLLMLPFLNRIPSLNEAWVVLSLVCGVICSVSSWAVARGAARD